MPFTDSLRFVEIIRADQSTLTAQPEDVTAGKVYIGTTKKIEVGNLPLLDQQDTDILLVSGESHTVKYGKNPKEYKVSVATLGDQTPATATADKILYPYTAWVDGVLITGSMPDNASVEKELLAGETYDIPLGYHDGTGRVIGVSLANQTQGNAEAEDIAAGKIAWVNGNEISGTLPVITDEEIILDAGQEYKIPFGKHSGNGVVKTKGLSEQTGGTAGPEDILDGETAWVNGVLITGTIPKIASQDIELPFNGEYVIPKGYHSGLGKVVQNIPVIEDQIVIAPAFEDQTIETAGKLLAQDIYVPGIDALNYQRTGDEYLINDESVPSSLNNAVIKTYTLPVDNWHDNATFNIYEIEVGMAGNSTTSYIPFDWKKGSYYTLDTGMFTVELSLEDGTNAHKFTYTGKDGYDVGYHFRVRELFHARQYGDDHDTDTSTP